MKVSTIGTATAVARRWQRQATHLFDPYRPELHYMRGPGPKWREKHDLSECTLR